MTVRASGSLLFVWLAAAGVLLAAADAVRAQTPAEPPLKVAVTFDDLPAHGPLAPGQQRRQVVESILATLQREKLPPVYGFMNGFRMEDYPYQMHILEAWRRAGEPLGNHTYGHEELDTETVAAFERDVLRNERFLKKLQPRDDWHWFRYPYTEEGNTLEKREASLAFLRAQGYKVAEVSLDFQDARWNDAYGLCSAAHDETGIRSLHDSYLAAADESLTQTRAMAHQLYGRDIAYVLLLHVGSFDARMLPELLALLRERGFTFTTLAEAEADPAYADDPAVAVTGGATFLDMVARSRGMTLPPQSPIPASVDHVCASSKAHIPAR